MATQPGADGSVRSERRERVPGERTPPIENPNVEQALGGPVSQGIGDSLRPEGTRHELDLGGLLSKVRYRRVLSLTS